MKEKREYENKGQELDALGYDQVDYECPLCGCSVMEKQTAVNTDPEGNGEVTEFDRVCPCCEWWEITYED
jgi:hypothetical protein